MFNCSKIEDELAEKQIVIFHKSVEYWPKMLRSVELTQAVGIHIDYEERNYGQKGSSIPSALNWSQISGKVQRAQTSDNGRYHSNSLIPYLPLSSSWSPGLSSVWGGGRSSTRSPHNSTPRTNTGGREMSLCSIRSSGKPLLKRFLKRHIITSQLWPQLDNGHNPDATCIAGGIAEGDWARWPPDIGLRRSSWWWLLWKWLVWLKPNFLSSGDATNLVDGKSLKYPPRKSDAHKLALSPRVDIIASHQQ